MIRTFCTAFLGLWALSAQAQTFDIQLLEQGGTAHSVGELHLTDTGHHITWDDSQFGDYFLSMRPFKCLEGAAKLWCRVAYPYDNPSDWPNGGLTALEYDLMFVWKRSNDYGIDLWNGVYYALSPDGTGYHGQMLELDLNILAAPPDAGVIRPIKEHMLSEADPSSHWLPELRLIASE